MLNFIKRFRTLLFSLLLLVAPTAVFALPSLLPGCTEKGDCTTCDAILLFTNLADLITIAISSIALLAVVVGGVMWIISAGNQQMVQRGRKILLSALVGVTLVIFGYMIVNTIIAGFTGAALDQTKLFGYDWATVCPKGTPSTAVSKCTSETEGAQCTDGCKGNCICYSEKCMYKCDKDAQTSGTGKGGVCVETEDQCTKPTAEGGQNGTVQTTSGDCSTSEPVCCRVDT